MTTMPIADYSYVVTMGQNCMPSYQLARAARHLRWSDARISGPFDWFGISIDQGISAIETKFRQFFDPSRVAIDGALLESSWKMTDAAGVVSWHHLHRQPADAEPSTAAWFGFGTWLGRRLALWERALADPQGKILVVRLEDAAAPDGPAALERLAEVLVNRCAGQLRIAAVSMSAPLTLGHPTIRTFAVKSTWPTSMHPLDVDWNTDYGEGVAWKGHDASWEALWERV